MLNSAPLCQPEWNQKKTPEKQEEGTLNFAQLKKKKILKSFFLTRSTANALPQLLLHSLKGPGGKGHGKGQNWGNQGPVKHNIHLPHFLEVLRGLPEGRRRQVETQWSQEASEEFTVSHQALKGCYLIHKTFCQRFPLGFIYKTRLSEAGTQCSYLSRINVSISATQCVNEATVLIDISLYPSVAGFCFTKMFTLC